MSRTVSRAQVLEAMRVLGVDPETTESVNITPLALVVKWQGENTVPEIVKITGRKK